MDAKNTDPTADFVDAFRKPSWVVVMVCQLLLGLALLITLVVKLYMLVLGEHACTPDGETLGNMIRCISTTELLGHFLLTVTGFRLVGLLFDPALGQILQIMFLGVCGTLILFLSKIYSEAFNWQAAMMLLVFIISLSILYLLQFGLRQFLDLRSESSKK